MVGPGHVTSEYLQVLGDLDGIKSYQLLKPIDPGSDALLKLRTHAGTERLAVQEYRSHLSHQMVDHIIAASKTSPHASLILAPHIGTRLATKLAEASLNYLDRSGNCHITLPSFYVHIEGKPPHPVTPEDKGLRSAGYQVLFAFLSDPTLLNAPLRTIAQAAGVSRQPASDMRERLFASDSILKTSKGTVWNSRRRQDVLNLWLHGYETTVRPSLLWHSFRTQESDPQSLEAMISTVLETSGSYELRWGGSAAGFRLSGRYRGERTVAHIRPHPEELLRQLRAVPDPAGNLIIMDAFGTVNWTPNRDTVHPLLVYSEMLSEGSERAREAAREVFEQHVEDGGSTGSEPH